MGTASQSAATYNKQSSGRDGTGNLKSVETSSSRGIVYPEDIELQGNDSDEDRAIRANNYRLSRGIDGFQSGKAPFMPDAMELKPAVRTEIAAGSPRHYTREGGIEVKRDFHIQKEFS